MNKYPDLITRVKAAFFDGIFLVILMFALAVTLDKVAMEDIMIRKVGFVFIFFLYDPIMTAFFGGTLGHLVNGLRVRSEFDENRNINIFMALIRYVVKVSLGFISFFYITSNEKGKAIHDLVAKSVVIEFNRKITDNKSELLDQ